MDSEGDAAAAASSAANIPQWDRVHVAAERGYLDAMVEPNQSRLALRQALRQLAGKTQHDLPKKHTISPM